MDISIYFEPIDKDIFIDPATFRPRKLGDLIHTYTKDTTFPSTENVDIAILGVKEERRAFNNPGCSLSANYVRKHLYKLYQGNYNARIVDLGNIKSGHSIEDTYFAVTAVLSELIQNNILPIIIGGSQDLTFPHYLAYENLGQIINIVSVDSHFDIGNAEEDFNSRSYLSKIILHQPNFLFNYTNIGYQTYFVDQNAIELMNKMHFDTYRLGVVRANMEEVEPMVRNADLLSFDISAIRQSDAPGNINATPNGFYGEEACQIVRYAGLSDKLTSIGFYESNPAYDREEQTSHLLAQMIWYFIEGFYSRKQDFPIKSNNDYLKYRVNILNQNQEIVFYKSKKSDRWWMEVPCVDNMNIRYERHHLIPCSYADYQAACRNEIPERWWQMYQKLI